MLASPGQDRYWQPALAAERAEWPNLGVCSQRTSAGGETAEPELPTDRSDRRRGTYARADRRKRQALSVTHLPGRP